jgi:hypothetical protein
MRVLALAIWTVATVSAIPSAHAQAYNPNYPVCLKIIENFGGERITCTYTSLAQCAETAAGLPAQCIVNPFYASDRPLAGRSYRR